MRERIKFLLSRFKEKLWVRPLTACAISIAGALIAGAADRSRLGPVAPDITLESLETLLTTISASMLVIATFAVGSMVSAYASASSTATPRTFSLVVADDVSQNALSAFIGAFIFSIVSLIAVQNDYYEAAGRLTLFVLTIAVFAIVIITFVRWVDRIARLGRLGTTIDKVESATRNALVKRLQVPNLGGESLRPRPTEVEAVYPTSIGYVQRIDMEILQSLAEQSDTRIEVTAIPGTFAAPGRVLAYVPAPSGDGRPALDTKAVAEAFIIGDHRTFDHDPRFGLIVLSEIASRALSPGINDPGTAIDVIGTLVRLFSLLGNPGTSEETPTARFDRVAVPDISLEDMLEDAFNAIARDGAGTIEVVVRLQKAFQALASVDHPGMREAAARQARKALARAERVLDFAADLDTARASAQGVR